MRHAFLILALSTPALAGDALDEVRTTLKELTSREGYVLNANWELEASDLQKLVRGSVKSTVQQKENFLRLDADFEDGDVTVFRRGDAIAGLNPETNEWESIASDAKAKFVLEMFDLRQFLQKAIDMGRNAREVAADDKGNLAVVFDLDEAELLKMLGKAEAGKALVGATFKNATMSVRVEMERGTRELKQVVMMLEGDAQGEAPKVVKEDEEFEEWTDEPKDPDGGVRKPREDDGEKKEAPAAQPPPTKHVKVQIRGTPSFKASYAIEVPVGAKKVLGIGG